MLKYSFEREDAAAAIENAVGDTLASGILTSDIASHPGDAVGTAAMGDAIAQRIVAGP